MMLGEIHPCSKADRDGKCTRCYTIMTIEVAVNIPVDPNREYGTGEMIQFNTPEMCCYTEVVSAANPDPNLPDGESLFARALIARQALTQALNNLDETYFLRPHSVI